MTKQEVKLISEALEEARQKIVDSFDAMIRRLEGKTNE